jgi:hypothetical protein
MVAIFGRVISPSHPSAFPTIAPAFPGNFHTNDQWAFDELGSIELGDLRSNRRMVKVLGLMLNSPGKSIPQCTHSVAEAKAFYRLLDVDALTDTLLFEVHRQSVLRRALASGCGVLLAIQDTTTCNFDSHHSLEGLGPISSNSARADFAGLHVHSTLLSAADEDQVFGLLGAKLYAREAGLRKKQAPGTRNRERIETKESFRWIESLSLAHAALQALQEQWPDQPDQPVVAHEASFEGEAAADPLMVSVGDREADIYELLIEAQQHREQGLGLLVRSQHNRSLVGEEALLWQHLSESDSAGSITLKLPRSQGKAARSATLSVRFSAVTIDVPAHKAKYLKMETAVQASIVELREEGEAGGICWRLLSTLRVTTLAQALRLARWYAKRWQIEEFHRILKTGCRVEARQMRSLERLKPMMALDMIVACSLMGMSAAARQQPESPASDWLDAEEISALEAYESKGQPRAGAAEPLSIGAAVKSIARLGGHLGRKGDGHPGAQVLWQGLHKLDAITEAWRRFGFRNSCG